MVFVDGFLGATLCKGLNRGIGTLLAGSLAFFIEFIAQESGQIFQAIFIGTIVFVVGMYLLYSFISSLPLFGVPLFTIHIFVFQFEYYVLF